MILEACIETLDQAMLAKRCGAHRLELCADLPAGGLTPPPELVAAVLAAVRIPVMAMVRPRAGGFVHTEAEFEEMRRTVEVFKKTGVAGVVFGFLTRSGEVDFEKTAALAALALPLEVTFHKAIDETPDPVEAVRLLRKIPGIRRVLTSGGAPTALEGKDVLKKMGTAAGEGLTILAAGKVTKENLAEVHRQIGAKEYHGRRIVF